MPRSRVSGLAVASLVLGVLAPTFGILAGLPALCCGLLARRRIGNDDNLEGAGIALAGTVLGWISLAVFIFVNLVRLFAPGGNAGSITPFIYGL